MAGLRQVKYLKAATAALTERTASVMIMTAICLPLLLTVIGFAADFGYASYLNQRLARASDTAALSALSQAAASAVGGYSNTPWLKTYGTSIFNENIKDLPISSVQFTLTVSQDTVTKLVTAAATYSYSFKPFFSRIIGILNIPVSGTVSAFVQPPTYINYYLVLDISNSMGIGATQADMAALYDALNQKGFVQNNEHGCVFACHVPNIGSNYTYSTEDVARQLGITLRIDSAVAAVQNVVNTAASIASQAKNIAFGIYLMQDNPNDNTQLLTLISPPSTNYSNVITKVNTIDLGDTNGHTSNGDTDYKSGLTAFNAILPNNGSGASAASPLNYVFLITDGVGDQLTSSCFAACVFPINSSWCDQLKAKATVGIIYTTYLEIWKNNDPSTKTYELLYDLMVKGIKDQIAPNLQSCATSSSFFFEASDGPAIITQMQALFAKTQSVSTRLTQ